MYTAPRPIFQPKARRTANGESLPIANRQWIFRTECGSAGYCSLFGNTGIFDSHKLNKASGIRRTDRQSVIRTMANLVSKLIKPWYPTTAIGFEKGLATMVQLERGKGGAASLRRAATVVLPESLIQPSFEESNVSDPGRIGRSRQ